jgi:DNA-binding HxlR family transcriptional regulator
MTRVTKTYGHFCMLAKTLEQVGDRWTLLVIRDLLVAPRRFTDLAQRLGGITATTLTERLRTLEAQGLIAADREAGRREVWYRLTPAGQKLEPALEALRLWGLDHLRRPPAPGEPVHPEHLLSALRALLARADVPGPARWQFRFREGNNYGLARNDGPWTLTEGDAGEPDVVVTTTVDAWFRFVTGTPNEQTARTSGVDIEGTARSKRTFLRDIAVFTPAVEEAS